MWSVEVLVPFHGEKEMRSSRFLLCLAILGCGTVIQAQTLPPPKPQNPTQQDSNGNAVPKFTPVQLAGHKLGDAFIKAFNSHDAAALGALWAKDATYSSSGEDPILKGRQAITDAYASFFKEDPECRISARAQAAQELDSGAIELSGILDEQHTDGTLTSSHFKAELRQENGEWKIHRVEEYPLPALQPPSVQLKQLQWLLGKWEDKGDNYRILTTVRMVDGGNYLVREYVRTVDGKPVQKGTQRIGWDHQQQAFRTWLFDEDGTFGEGYLTQDADQRWSLRLALKLPRGAQGSLTQIIHVVGPDQLDVQNVDIQVDGIPFPNTPKATLIKLSDNASEAQAAQP